MKIVKPSYKIQGSIDKDKVYKSIELVGRVCYKSEELITNDSAEKFVKMIVNRGHLAMIEHESMSVKFICDRGVSHELVRHRLASFAQESTRYCDYSKNKFGTELTFIEPLFFECKTVQYDIWKDAMLRAEESYMLLRDSGATPQEARSILPNSLKTEIVVTANLREWLTIFSLRDSNNAHPQMVELMRPLHNELKQLLPAIFGEV